MKRKSKVLALVLSTSMVFSILPASMAYAEEPVLNGEVSEVVVETEDVASEEVVTSETVVVNTDEVDAVGTGEDNAEEVVAEESNTEEENPFEKIDEEVEKEEEEKAEEKATYTITNNAKNWNDGGYLFVAEDSDLLTGGVEAGTRVYVVPWIRSGYELVGIYVESSTLYSSIDFNDTYAYFTMPASNVTITASFAPSTVTKNVSFSVKDSATNAPVADAAYMLYRYAERQQGANEEEYHRYGWYANAFSDQNGIVTFDNVPVGDYICYSPFSGYGYLDDPGRGFWVEVRPEGVKFGLPFSYTDGSPFSNNCGIVYKNPFDSYPSTWTVQATKGNFEFREGEVENGEILLNCRGFNAGHLGMIMAYPNEGYLVNNAYYIKEGGGRVDLTLESGGANNAMRTPYFTLPAANIVGYATFARDTHRYNVGINPAENGTAEVNYTAAMSLSDIIVTPRPNEGYKCTGVKYVNTAGSVVNATAGSDGKYTFSMPQRDTTVSLTFAKENYTINSIDVTQGKVTPSKITAQIGNNITVTVAPNPGYQLTKLTWKPAGGVETDITSTKAFIMPGKNVTLAATWSKTNQTITGVNTTEGKATPNKTTAQIGETITVTVEPNPGYQLTKLTYTPQGGTATDITSGKSFTMPGKNVTLAATWSKTNQTITGVNTTEGKATPNKPSAQIGETITVTVEPNPGYQLTKLTWTPQGGTATDITSGKSFTMPGKNVTLAATWSKISYSVTARQSTGGTIEVNKESATMGEEITVTVTPVNGYELQTLTYTPADGNAVEITSAKKFTMPAANVTVDAVWKSVASTTYNVTVASGIQNGTVTVSTEKAEAGAEVTVTAEPATGYVVDKITYTPANGTAIDITTAKKFNMPAADVTVSATFKGQTPDPATEYNVTVANGIQNGTVTVSAEKAKADTEVTVTATPATGYVVDKITYTPANGTAIDITTAKKFNMPAADVTVNATFAKVDDIDPMSAVVDKTAGTAQISGVKNGDGTYTYTVECDDACVVAISDDNGESYTRVDAVNNGDGTYSFNVAELPANRKVYVAKKGDLNSDGEVTVTEGFQVKRFANELREFTTFEFLVADLDGNGEVSFFEGFSIQRQANNMHKISW